MRGNGLHGVSRRWGWCVTTNRDKERRPAPDLVQREFAATGINQLRVANMTYNCPEMKARRGTVGKTALGRSRSAGSVICPALCRRSSWAVGKPALEKIRIRPRPCENEIGMSLCRA